MEVNQRHLLSVKIVQMNSNFKNGAEDAVVLKYLKDETTIVKSNSANETARAGKSNYPAPRQLKKKAKSGRQTGGEILLKEIQAMIISQDITRNNRAKMAQVGGQHALRFLNDPKLNEHKTIAEKFQRRKFQSLATNLYKSKLTNNPMRNEIKLLPLSTGGNTEMDKENMPAVSMQIIKKPSIQEQQTSAQMDFLQLPKMTKAERNALGVEKYGQNKTFDYTTTNRLSSNFAAQASIQAKQSYNTQTLSSQYRSELTAKSFDGKQASRFNNVLTQMPELKNAHNEPIDLSLAQIVQLGKTKQRQIQNMRTKQEQRRSSSQGATTNITRKMPLEDSEIAANEENSVVQTDLNLAAIQAAPKRTQTSSQTGINSTRTGNMRYIFRDADSNQQRNNRMITAPAFITQNNRGAYDTADGGNKMKTLSMSEPSLGLEPAIISQSGVLKSSGAPREDPGAVGCCIEQVLPRQFVKLFIARQKDLQLSKSIELQLMRFSQLIFDQSPSKLVLREQGFGSFSAKALSKIIRKSDEITSIDLSLNNLSLGLQSLFHGIIDNQSLVALTLKNNSIDGRRFQQQIFDLVYQHPSLASLNLGNNLTVKNRNRIHNEGLSAILQAIASSKIPSLIQELYLSNCSITAKGLKQFALIEQNQAHFHLQVLDLSNNELGSQTPKLIKSVIPTLISLNLSHTKMEVKGAFLLAQYLKLAHKQNKKHILRSLDLSYNDIASAGFVKLLSRFKKSTSLNMLNFSGNSFVENQEKFINIEKFLSRNESCKLLQLSGCKLQATAMAFIGLGLSKNFTLERIVLSENDFCGRESIHYLVKGLLDSQVGSKLIDIDLSGNKMKSETVQPFVNLFEQNFKIRSLNLRNNLIMDEGAQLLAQAVVNNEFITRLLCDMNPIRHSILTDIESHTKLNQQKVNDQEVPQMISEILDVKKRTAQSLYDCVQDPMIKEKMQIVMHPSRLINLRRASAKGGSLHRRSEGPVGRQDQELLLRNKFFDSYDVVAITDEIETQLKTLAIDKQQTFEIYQENETVKERMVDEDKARLQELKNERDQLLGQKREMEFEIIMLEEAGKGVQAREKLRCDDVENHIESLKLKQEKIKDQIKEIYSERGIKDQDCDLVRKAFEKEYDKVMRQLNITKIIHDTYVKEMERFLKKQQQEEDKRKRQLSEDRRVKEAEEAMQREIAAAEEESRRKQEAAAAKRKRASTNGTMIGIRASRQSQQAKDAINNKKMQWNQNRVAQHRGGSKSFSKTGAAGAGLKDVMGMNSPSKKRQADKDIMEKSNSPSKKRGPNALPQRQPNRSFSIKSTAEKNRQLTSQIKNDQLKRKVITSFNSSQSHQTKVVPTTSNSGSKQVNDLTEIAKRAADPDHVIKFTLGVREQESLNDEPSLRKHNNEGTGSMSASSKVYEIIETQENDTVKEDNESVASFKQEASQEDDECSKLRLQDTNLSGCQNTTGVTVKVNSVNQSQRNLPVRPVLMTANATIAGQKNFHGLGEITADERSSIMVVKHEMAASVSQGRWSSDIQDETLTLTNSLYGAKRPPQTASAFADQNRQ